MVSSNENRKLFLSLCNGMCGFLVSAGLYVFFFLFLEL